ncbi:Diacylglycerol kinase 7-like protein [Drosera capensis]
MDQAKKHGVLLLVKPAFLITSRNCGQRDLLIGNDWEEGSCSAVNILTLACGGSYDFATRITSRFNHNVQGAMALLARVSHMFALIFSTSDVNQVLVSKITGINLKDVKPDEFVKYGLGSLEHLAAKGDRCSKEAREKI